MGISLCQCVSGGNGRAPHQRRRGSNAVMRHTVIQAVACHLDFLQALLTQSARPSLLQSILNLLIGGSCTSPLDGNVVDGGTSMIWPWSGPG
eukprot:gene29161-32382_t